MGLISKIEDKLGGHKNDSTTTDSKHSNTSGLNSSSTGHHGTGSTGTHGLSSGTTGAGMTGAGSGAGSSVRHPVQSAENDFGRNTAGSSYPTGSGAHTGTSSHIPGGNSSVTGGSSHIPGGSSHHNGPVPGSIQQTSGGYGGSSGGYGTETHPSLREQERMGGSGAGYSGPASNTVGPHSSNAANIIDPRVQPDSQLQGSNKHHYGRDAALAGGAGGAAYEAEKHHGHHNNHGSSHHATPQQPYDPYSSAGQRTAASNVPGQSQYGRSGHHTGIGGASSRDREPSDLLPGHQAQNPSAIPTAGGAPVGSHGYNSSHEGYDDGKKEAYRQSAMGGGSGTTAGPHNSSLLNKLDPRVDSDRSKQQEHHYGRDAALAGGAGAAGYEADRHHRDHERDHTGSHGIGGSSTGSHGIGSSNTGSHGIGGSTSSPTSHTGGTSGGLAPERKLGGAYEAGYRDALEHMKAEMGQR